MTQVKKWTPATFLSVLHRKKLKHNDEFYVENDQYRDVVFPNNKNKACNNSARSITFLAWSKWTYLFLLPFVVISEFKTKFFAILWKIIIYCTCNIWFQNYIRCMVGLNFIQIATLKKLNLNPYQPRFQKLTKLVVNCRKK